VQELHTWCCEVVDPFLVSSSFLLGKLEGRETHGEQKQLLCALYCLPSSCLFPRYSSSMAVSRSLQALSSVAKLSRQSPKIISIPNSLT
jgi:hypothetical protein